MIVFDGLLNDVLHDAANPQAPCDLDHRIVAGLPRGSTHARHRLGLWAGIAAAFVIGVAGLVSEHVRSRTPLVAPAVMASLTVQNYPFKPELSRAGERRQIEGTTAAEGVNLPSGTVTPSRAIRQHPAMRVDLLEVEPIVIRPIEVALIAHKTSTMKGKTR